VPDRKHDVSQVTVGELQRTRRDLEVSVALISPGSPARAPILAHLKAIDAELAKRAAGEQDLDLVFGGGGGVGASGRDSPDQETWLGLFQVPAFGLFAPMMMTA
jgi:hypothetical protein